MRSWRRTGSGSAIPGATSRSSWSTCAWWRFAKRRCRASGNGGARPQRPAASAWELGLVLIHSALSPNIRERRDCSAALFDADGAMIAQAAHIPVHLGALAESVGAVRALEPPPRPGETFILNDPFTGGSHL